MVIITGTDTVIIMVTAVVQQPDTMREDARLTITFTDTAIQEYKQGHRARQET